MYQTLPAAFPTKSPSTTCPRGRCGQDIGASVFPLPTVCQQLAYQEPLGRRSAGAYWREIWSPHAIRIRCTDNRYRKCQNAKSPCHSTLAAHRHRRQPLRESWNKASTNMYICMHVCECMYVCMNECMHVCLCVCMYECMYVCMYEYMYICMYVCMYGCMYVCMYV